MPDAALLLELGGVILGLGVLAWVAQLLGLTPVPLYLLAGLAFGKGGLVGLVTSHEFIATGADIGVVLLLFTLGLEYSAADFLANLRVHAPVGALDLVLNGAPGAIAGLLLGWGAVPTLVLAGVTAVSSSGIAAKILSDLGRLGNRETPAVLSVLVLEDLAMAIYLPILGVLLAGLGVLAGVRAVVVALGALAVAGFIALRLGARLSQLVFSRDTEVLLLRLCGLALLVAGAAAELKISAAVGAFLLGIALSGPVADVARKILTPLRDLFAAVFFVFFGLQINPGLLGSSVPAAFALGGAGVLTKVATGWAAARQGDIGLPGRVRAGTALVARGEFSIVIAGLAVTAGTEPTLGPLAATYILLMAVVGPVLARASDVITRRLQAMRRKMIAENLPGTEEDHPTNQRATSHQAQ